MVRIMRICGIMSAGGECLYTIEDFPKNQQEREHRHFPARAVAPERRQNLPDYGIHSGRGQMGARLEDTNGEIEMRCIRCGGGLRGLAAHRRKDRGREMPLHSTLSALAVNPKNPPQRTENAASFSVRFSLVIIEKYDKI